MIFLQIYFYLQAGINYDILYFMEIHKLITNFSKIRDWEFAAELLEVFGIPMCVLNPADDTVEAHNLAFRALWTGDTQPKTATALFANQLGELITFTEAVSSARSFQTHDLVPTQTKMPNSFWIVQGSQVTMQMRARLLLVLIPIELLNQAYVEYLATGTTKSSVTERKQFRYLYQQEASLKNLILDSAGEGIFGIDEHGNTTFVNRAARKILGYKEDDLLGKNMHDAIHHSHPDGTPYPPERCEIVQSTKEGRVRTVATEVFWCADGRAVPVEYTATPLDTGGDEQGSVVVFRDITARLTRESALEDALAEVASLKEKLQQENEYLKNEMREVKNLSSNIIGQSETIQKLREQIEIVGRTGATVLISGESGSGKELIAEAIHENSPRCDNVLVKVNCGAIPRDLFESEFFGHVKGAFSGAINNRVGRFELADGGTLFLDEIGELPIELQPKLLRVIQEGEFDRIGDTKTRKVNVRLVAATNRDLTSLIRDGLFREDLYFRLNVFPISSPSLRDRLDDIPTLVKYFAENCCSKLALNRPQFDDNTLEALRNYSWPGNVRELQNVIERGCILAKGGQFKFEQEKLYDTQIDRPSNETPDLLSSDRFPSTLSDIKRMEHELIIKIMRQTGGKVSGPGGAAGILKVKPTTLYSKLKNIPDLDDKLKG